MRTILIIILCGFLSLPSLIFGQERSDAAVPGEEEATIYFYRKPEFYNGRFACWLDDTRLINNFQASSYFWLNIPAGTYKMRTNGRPSWIIYEKEYQLEVEAGKVYYIEGVIDYDFLGTALFLQVRSQEDFDELRGKIKFDERAIRSLD